jgi:small subunit ribosomal protein S1
VNVRILEVDAERRRLSLSLKRVDEGMPVQPKPGDEAAPPTIDLSEDVFSDESAPLSSDDAVEAGALDESGGEGPAPEAVSSDEPVEGSDEAAPE